MAMYVWLCMTMYGYMAMYGYVWLCMAIYVWLCMAMYVWQCMYGYVPMCVCMAMCVMCLCVYVWQYVLCVYVCMYGSVCMAMYVWKCMHGSVHTVCIYAYLSFLLFAFSVPYLQWLSYIYLEPLLALQAQESQNPASPPKYFEHFKRLIERKHKEDDLLKYLKYLPCI